MQKFMECVKSGDISAVTKTLAKNPDLAKARDETGLSAILVATYQGHEEIKHQLLAAVGELDLFEASATGQHTRVAEILDKEPKLVEAFSPDGFSALGLAAFFGHPEVMKVLLNHGADPNLPASNPMQTTPLHSAVANRGPATALKMTRELLARGAKVNVSQAGGWTPLHQAAAHGQEPLIRLLIAHGAERNAQSDDGRTPLAMAEERGHKAVLALL